uniref:Uncharacterized protein n=1 Tax=Chromera velia CCMP2878 TaxID=1169474 RepID=A0A0G4FEW2_9ALVE|eukprot:Cvel_16577.t1-p1 / transcript=Cvel_16577.t1 / gene=Cvel_16577 / organism=Chromera_velia_CCMP2878 / gene_product=hypothetical protein / transcript_product=hypothetical protein / location=Cvel_scaffold1283:7833-10021(+) / protein_length=458 / sequence_SO=supercontig / SO=protein_coding / is_pseudo=false
MPDETLWEESLRETEVPVTQAEMIGGMYDQWEKARKSLDDLKSSAETFVNTLRKHANTGDLRSDGEYEGTGEAWLHRQAGDVMSQTDCKFVVDFWHDEAPYWLGNVAEAGVSSAVFWMFSGAALLLLAATQVVAFRRVVRNQVNSLPPRETTMLLFDEEEASMRNPIHIMASSQQVLTQFRWKTFCWGSRGRRQKIMKDPLASDLHEEANEGVGATRMLFDDEERTLLHEVRNGEPLMPDEEAEWEVLVKKVMLKELEAIGEADRQSRRWSSAREEDFDETEEERTRRLNELAQSKLATFARKRNETDEKRKQRIATEILKSHTVLMGDDYIESMREEAERKKKEAGDGSTDSDDDDDESTQYDRQDDGREGEWEGGQDQQKDLLEWPDENGGQKGRRDETGAGFWDDAETERATSSKRSKRKKRKKSKKENASEGGEGGEPQALIAWEEDPDEGGGG